MNFTHSSMSVMPFIITLVLAGRIKKSMKAEGLLPKWGRPLQGITFLALGLLCLEIFFKVEMVTMWVWHIFLLAQVYFYRNEKDFVQSKAVAVSVIPYVVVAVITDLFKVFLTSVYERWDSYFNTANLLTVGWMVAIWFSANRQEKLAEKERVRRQQEEAINKVIAARKDELEGMVEERTAELTRQKEELQETLSELKSTQDQLIQQEKLASLGELTAGIAHEIQNPLNFVNNFSEVSIELLDELEAELEKGDKDEVIAIAGDIKQNLLKISQHGKRADGIVKGMLQHSRKSTGMKEPVNLNDLADEYLRLSYHGLRAKDKSFNATLNTAFDSALPAIPVIPQELGRVLLNMFNNAFYSVSDKKKLGISGYEPTVSVSTAFVDGDNGGKEVVIKIRDNGMGIPQRVLDKIYQPFFTTKPTGEGTGLGLSLSYDIVTKVHGGELNVDTREGEFAEFTISLPAA